MEKKKVHLLHKKAKETAEVFSNPARGYGEIFQVSQIIPLSETTAIVDFAKNTNKHAMTFFYWINGNGGYWQYYFPTYDHCVGMEKVREYLHKVEIHNFDKNGV